MCARSAGTQTCGNLDVAVLPDAAQNWQHKADEMTKLFVEENHLLRKQHVEVRSKGPPTSPAPPARYAHTIHIAATIQRGPLSRSRQRKRHMFDALRANRMQVYLETRERCCVVARRRGAGGIQRRERSVRSL